MELLLDGALIRNWRETDAVNLAKNADNPRIAANLRDGFPSPYSLDDARRFLARAPDTYGCIEVDGEAAGGIGFTPGQDVERFSAELGYWLAEQHWGRGIMTQAVARMRRYVLGETKIERLFALPFVTSAGSIRVLERCGFALEGRLRRSAFKHGRFVDQLMFAAIAHEEAVALEPE